METNNGIIEGKIQKNLSFLIEDSEAFSLTAFKVMQNDSNGFFVKSMQLKRNGKIQLIYFTEKYMSLQNALNQLAEEKLTFIISETFKRLKALNEYGFLDMNDLLTDFDKIYIDMQTLAVKFIYLPVYIKDSKEHISAYMRIKSAFILFVQETTFRDGSSNQMSKLRNILTDRTLELDDMIRKLSAVNIIAPREAQKRKTEPVEKKKRAQILYLENKNTGKRIDIKNTELILGRKPPVKEGIISEDKRVGRQHCRIFRRDYQYFVSDMHSVNGTYVNGERISAGEETEINDGDIIRVVNIELLVKGLE